MRVQYAGKLLPFLRVAGELVAEVIRALAHGLHCVIKRCGHVTTLSAGQMELGRLSERLVSTGQLASVTQHVCRQ